MDKNNKKLMVIVVLTVVFTIAGGTLAYWNWQSTNSQKTNVVFTVGADFSCSADGGGSITNANYFVPTDCTNSTYAIQKTITTNITNNGELPVSMDLWLNIDYIGTGLTNSNNFKYALTTNPSSCTTGVKSQGTFHGKVKDDKIQLLSDVTTGGIYYLYVWLDKAETDTSTMNQRVTLSLGGECSNEVLPAPTYVYTANIYDENATNNNSVTIGQPIPNTITTYSTPEEAITVLETVYSNANSGAIASLPVFLRHTISPWCMALSGGFTSCDAGEFYETKNECVSNLQEMAVQAGATDNGDGTFTYEGGTVSCIQSTDNTVKASHVGFVVTPEMALANPGMVAGTYYLKGGSNNSNVFNNNKAVLQSAFGTSSGYCYNGYNPSGFSCSGVSDLRAYAYSSGIVEAGAYDVTNPYSDGEVLSFKGSSCEVDAGGNSYCEADSTDGGGVE